MDNNVFAHIAQAVWMADKFFKQIAWAVQTADNFQQLMNGTQTAIRFNTANHKGWFSLVTESESESES